MKKNYSKYSLYITALVVVMMLGVSFIPPLTIGGVKLKRANIISELYKFEDDLADSEVKISKEDQAFIDEMERAERELKQAEAQEDKTKPKAESWDIGGDIASADWRPNSSEQEAGEQLTAPLVGIEDYSEEGDVSIADFCALLGTATQDRVVRLGFLGDSYIEGDIITADVRQQLQTMYGGGGVGFISFESPLAANKPTVKHTFGGWSNYNLINKSRAPEELQDKFYVSGAVSVPKEGAWTQYQSVNFRRNLSKVSIARMIFTNTEASTIHMVINDTIERRFTPESSELPQQINISGGNLKDIKINIENPEGFYGYGVVMESGRGVGVDNYSIRGNSGLALFGSNATVNSRINNILGYDLIVLQYGLNIMEAEVTGYAGYGKQLVRIINYMKSCFPRAAIVVMGVGDRCMQKEGEFVTMPAVGGMIAAQRKAAKECGVAFWSIYDVMAHFGGMVGFVDKGWAAKDYTHLSYGGGRKIASEFVKALEYIKHTSSPREEEIIKVEGGVAPQRIESISTFEAVDSTALYKSGERDSLEFLKIAEPETERHDSYSSGEGVDPVQDSLDIELEENHDTIPNSIGGGEGNVELPTESDEPLQEDSIYIEPIEHHNDVA